MPAHPIVQAQGITKSFGTHRVIEAIDVTLYPKEIVCLLGESGAGKTTLFNILAGLSLPDQGQVLLEGKKITGKPGHISYMQQKDLLLPFKTILQNVSLPLQIKGKSARAAQQKALDFFPTFGLEGTADKYPAQLSGGMRQRAAFLRTYLFTEHVVLLDEPFSALDTLTKQALHTWYLQMAAKLELSTLFITHDIDEAIFLSDRVYILAGRPGRIACVHTIDSLRPRDARFSTTPAFINYKKRILESLETPLAARKGVL